MTSIGANITIYCYLTGVDCNLNNLLRRRYNYDGSSNLNLISTNVPNRYTIVNSVIDSSNSHSLLTITGIIVDDFATYVCQSSSMDSANLTQLRKLCF